MGFMDSSENISIPQADYLPQQGVKTIALVGNCPAAYLPDDYTREIEAMDLVVRISKMCNIESGKVGKRTDVLFLEPNPMFHRVASDEKKMSIRQVPTIFVRKDHAKGWGGTAYVLGEDTMKSHGHTTLAAALYHLRRMYKNAIIHLYGSDTGEARRKNVLKGLHAKSDEVELMREMEALEELVIHPVITTAEGAYSSVHIEHQHWSDDLLLYENGYCRRVNTADEGSWDYADNELLVRWYKWQAERFTCNLQEWQRD